MEYNALRLEIVDSLKKTETNAKKIRHMSATLLTTGIVASASTTFISAATAGAGPVIGNWSISCALSAAFGFIATVCIGLHQAMGYSQRLQRINQCAGKLASINLSITNDNSKPEDVLNEYKNIVSSFPEELRSL
jgi:hypothetical protein